MSEKQNSSGLYLSRIRCNMPQNNFHKEVMARCENYDRLLITDPQAFIAELKDLVQKIHLKHPRAKEMKFDIYRHTPTEPCFDIGGVIFFTLFIVRGKYSVDGITPYLPFEKGGDDGL